MIDWMQDDWSYMLGVVHGDGHISDRSVSVSVGYKDQGYADVLTELWKELGFQPKVYRPRSALRIDVHSKKLRDQFAVFKRKGIWSWPESLNVSEYLSGVFDTDGYSSITGGKKQIGVTLKRSGNLNHLISLLESVGINGLMVKNEISKFKGIDYETESIRITDSVRISRLASILELRNQRKAKMLDDVRCQADSYLNAVPLFREVGLWIEKEGSKSWEDISIHFGLTKKQCESVMQNLRQFAEIRVIPPPKIYTKYEVIRWKTEEKNDQS
jgi:hypothetical protein